MYDTTPPPAVIEYAEAHGFTHGVRYVGTGKDCTIYRPIYPEKNTYWGLPRFIVSEGNILRWIDKEEARSLMNINT